MRTLLAAACLSALLAACAKTDPEDASRSVDHAHAVAGHIEIARPWVRAAGAGSPSSAVYFEIRNTGDAADRLLSASSPVAEHVELHESATGADGVSRMRPTPVVEIAPGDRLAFEPGGYHVMLIGLRQDLDAGVKTPVTLVFERAGEVALEAEARAVAGGGHANHHGR